MSTVPNKLSRAGRWINACTSVKTAAEDLDSALSDLKSIQEEFEEWKDNLPESLQSSAVGEKLDTVCELEIDSAIDSVSEITSLADEAEGIDLPRGFGRD